MGKNNTKVVLIRVFQDITNIADVIEESKKVKELCKEIDFDDHNEAKKIIENTKAIVTRLKGDVNKISEYFDENYSVWQEELADNQNKDYEKAGDQNEIEKDPLNEIPQDSDLLSESARKELSNKTNATVEVDKEHSISKSADTNDKLPYSNEIDSVDKEICKDVESHDKEKDDVSEKQDCNEQNVTIETPKENNEVSVMNEICENNNEKDKEESDSAISDETQNIGENTDKEVIQVKPEKVFLKCIDINKLKALPKPNGADDSVLVISDSEPENEKSNIGSSKKPLHKRKDLAKHGFPLSASNKNTALDVVRKLGEEITISKVNKNQLICNIDESDVVIVDEQIRSDKINGIGTVKSNKSAINNNLKVVLKKKSIKDSLKITGDIDIDSSSESEKSSNHVKTQKVKRKLSKRTKKEEDLLDAQSDKQFGYDAYVPLPRYPCNKLKQLYLSKMEHNEIKRLTNLRNLKKRKLGTHSKESDASSTDREKRSMKRKRRLSENSSKASCSDGNCSDASLSNKKVLLNTEINDDPTKALLNDIDSATEVSSDENDKKRKKKDKTKEVEKKKTSSSESSEDDKKKKSKKESSDSDAKKTSKWRRDKLLRKKLTDSDSESEDELDKFKKLREKSKSKIKKKLSKQKGKKVIISDSSSDSDSQTKKKKTKKKSESSEASSSSSSSSSESEESSDHRKTAKKNQTKKGGRIKRVKDSSSDDDKTTRKTIRRLIGHESLQETTKQAEKEEKERKARIAERQKRYNAIFDKPEDAVVEKVVLDFDEESKEELLSVDKSIVAKLKPHQAKGVQFMWNACFESLERTKKTNGSGCILAHCMGLGKTLQVIALVHTLITNKDKTDVEKVLVVCPLNTVLNWIDEFNKWLVDAEGPEIELFELVSNKQNSYRQYLVKEWSKRGGVLVIGYDMFRNITNPANKRLKKQVRETFYSGMVDPGPDLIICDEGHLLKNEKTHLSVAVSRVRTERRIVLTGTPMQNNLKEYYCMVQFVKPNLLGTYKEYLNRFVNPITNGQYTDSTLHDISIMKKRSHVLHKMLDGIVQRKDYNVLAPFLPPKYEYVLFTRLSEVQIKLYQHYMDNFARRPVESKLRKTAFLFSDFQEFQRICTHPRVLKIKEIENKKKAFFKDASDESEGSLKDFIDDDESAKSSSSSSSSSSDDEDEVSGGSAKDKDKAKDKDSKKPTARMTRNSAAAAGLEVTDILDDFDDVSNAWWQDIVDGDELENIALGGKLYLLFEILQQCELIGDKILIFSQSLYSLNIIEYFLHKIDEATQDGKNETVCGFSGSWALGLDYFRIDGSSSCDNRAAWCKSFNSPDNHRARLFLISTKAGGLGINLTGANRVIIFDVSWNPSHDTQSIYRVYRFGQTKPCYIYRFVTWGTMEMKIYERQVTKQAISKRVIDEQQIDRHYNQNDLAELYKFDPHPEEAPTPLLPKDVLLAELLQKEKERIYKYHEHQSLLENIEEEQLDEAERKAAWEEFENEKINPPVATTGLNSTVGGWIKNLPLTSISAALMNIIQRDNPTWTRDQVQGVIPLVITQLREQVDAGEMLLFNRIVSELRMIQAQQQQKLQQYYIQQQMLLMQQQRSAQAGGKQMTGAQAFRNILENALNTNVQPTNSNEIVELND